MKCGHKCDFCSEQQEELKPYIPLANIKSVSAGGLTAEVLDFGPWCACTECAKLIDADKWTELAARALVPLRKLVGEVSDGMHLQAVKSMWTVVFGERVKFDV